jgi:hypothetical protein
VKLRDHAKALGLDVGCSDNSCIWGGPGGMGTNGGCRCTDRESDRYDMRVQVRSFARVAQHLAAEVERLNNVVAAFAASHVAKGNEVERMRPVAEAALARRRAFHARHAGDIDEEAYGAARDAFQAALDDYEKAGDRG